MTRRKPLTALGALMLVSGCATIQTSPLNPFNWFDGPAVVTATDDVAPAAPPPLVPGEVALAPDLRQPVARVGSVSLDRTPDSILVTARGQTAAPGHFNAALVPAGVEDGYLVLEFRAEPPPAPVAGEAGLTAGYVLGGALAAGLRGVRVVAAENALARSF